MTAINPNLSFPGIARRLAAMFYDALLLAALWFFAAALLMVVTGGHLANPDRPLWLLGALQLSLLLVLLLFFSGFWVKGGQTLGMRAWRLRLVTTRGEPVNWSQAIWRLVAAVPSLGLFGIGFFWMLIDRERIAMHDRLTGTRLILLAKKN